MDISLPQFLLDWGLAATSLFDTIVLIWLGLTVLLNAGRRDWGTRLAGSGMLLGGAFFLIHTTSLDYNFDALLSGIATWWYVCWLCVLALPLGWYVLMLWYAGAWNSAGVNLSRRHQRGLVVCCALGLTLCVLIVVNDPTRLLKDLAGHHGTWSGAGYLLGVLPLYLLTCTGFSLLALREAGRPHLGANLALENQARRRARPWLMASTAVQLLASLMVGVLLLYMVWRLQFGLSDALMNRLMLAVTLSELVISLMVGIAVVLMGKAVVSFEIFTGKTLPRRGFLRQWRNIVGVAAAYSLLVGLCWASPLPSVYPLVTTTLLLSVFFALFSWRGYVESEQHTAQLRPFVASQGLFRQLLTSDENPPDATAPFQALCTEVLNTRAAYLAAVGPLAALAGAPLTYAPGEKIEVAAPGELAAGLTPQTLCVALENRPDALRWLVPLWSERGLIGVLLLGEKRDGGLFTQEEMEIARAGCERLLDAQAGAELARRVMALQRQHVAQTQMLDRQTRRVLHDDVLPRLHAVLLTYQDAPPEAQAQLAEAHREISALLRAMPGATSPTVARLGLVEALRVCVAEEHPGAFDEVAFEVEPDAEKQAQTLPPMAAEALFFAAREAVRNAAKHARPAAGDSAPLQLRVALKLTDGLELTVDDNGIGPQPTAEERGGSGQGLALHGAMLAILGGTLELAALHPGTRVILRLPVG